MFVSLLSLGFVGEMVEVGTTTNLDAVDSQLALIAAAKTLEYIPQGRARETLHIQIALERHKIKSRKATKQSITSSVNIIQAVF